MSSSFRVSRFWLFAAVGLAVLATWLAARAERNPVPDYRAGTFPPPVLPTRGVERKTAAPAVGDAAERYVERRQRGMAPREIRWILEDFQQAGLDEDNRRALRVTLLASEPDAATQASFERQAIQITTQERRWYLAALAEGFSLDPEQQRQARSRADELLSRQIEAARGQSGSDRIAKSVAHAWLLEPANWQSEAAMTPAALCKLNESQLTILSREKGSASAEAGASASAAEDGGTTPGRQALEFVDSVFPRTAEQSSGVEGRSLLESMQRLHPAQLRLLLLADLALEAKVQAQLQEAGE